MIEFTIELRQLQHTFDRHARVFGITGEWSSATAAQFERAIREHVHNPTVAMIEGRYRGRTEVTHFFDPETRIWVAIDTNNNFVAAWQLSPTQVEHLYRTGNVQ